MYYKEATKCGVGTLLLKRRIDVHEIGLEISVSSCLALLHFPEYFCT